MNGAIVGFIAASLFFGLVLRRSKAAPPGGPDLELDRPLVMRYGRPMVTLGWVSVAVVPAVITLIVLFAPLDDVHRARGAFLNVLILGLGLYVLLEALRFEVRVGPDGLAHRSAWSGRLALRWDEVERVAFSRFNMWFVVHAAGGRTRRVSLIVPGVVGFLAACERYLPAEALAGAQAGYEMLGRPFPGAGRG